MAILGVLLGITMCVGAWAINEIRRMGRLATENHKAVITVIDEHESRIDRLEKRKALLEQAATSYQATGSGPAVRATKLRTWNEDAAPVEAK